MKHAYLSFALCAVLVGCGGGGGGGGGGGNTGNGGGGPPPPNTVTGSEPSKDRQIARDTAFSGANTGGVAGFDDGSNVTGGSPGTSETTTGRHFADGLSSTNTSVFITLPGTPDEVPVLEHLQHEISPISDRYSLGTWSASGFSRAEQALAAGVTASAITVDSAVRGNLYEGQYTHPGTTDTAQFAIYVTENGFATTQFFLWGGVRELDYLNTEGRRYSGRAPAGDHTYQGFSRAFQVGTFDNLVTARRDGTFTMGVTFRSGTGGVGGEVTSFEATLSDGGGNESTVSKGATAPNYEIGFSGCQGTECGTFTGDVIFADVSGSAFFNAPPPTGIPGKILGDFHGNESQGVSGVYHSDNYSTGTRFGGAFAGQR